MQPEHSYKQITFHSIFNTPEGLLSYLLQSKIKSTNVWNWSLSLKLTHTCRLKHRAHNHHHPCTQWLCVNPSTSRPLSWNRALRVAAQWGACCTTPKIYHYTGTHTHTVKHTRSSQHRHARMFFHSITDSPDTLPWSPTQSCTSLHHKVLCLQLKEVVYLHKQVSKTKTNGLHVSPHHTSHAV